MRDDVAPAAGVLQAYHTWSRMTTRWAARTASLASACQATAASLLRLCCLLLMLVAGGCDPAPSGAPALPEEDAEPPAATGEWVTVLERTMSNLRYMPEPFTVRSDSLRIIAAMEVPSSPYLPGLLIINILSPLSSLPIASVRGEQRRLNVATVDTTVVHAGAGNLEFFVADNRGLTDWKITIQEFVEAN